MAVTVEEDPFREAGTEVIIALNSFDVARHSLYDFVSELVAQPQEFDAFQDEISNKASEASETFVGLVKALYGSDFDADEKADRIKQLWLADEKERKDLFSQLTECKDFLCGNSECTGDCIDNAYEAAFDEAMTSDEIINKLDEFYSEELTDDVTHMVNHIGDIFENATPDKLSRKERIAKEAGKHAIDVSKIAAGVVIAELVVRALR